MKFSKENFRGCTKMLAVLGIVTVTMTSSGSMRVYAQDATAMKDFTRMSAEAVATVALPQFAETQQMVYNYAQTYAVYDKKTNRFVQQRPEVATMRAMAGALVPDATKFNLTGNYIVTHDVGADYTAGVFGVQRFASPDPQIVRNADGSFNIVMYQGQSVAFITNNPYGNDYVPAPSQGRETNITTLYVTDYRDHINFCQLTASQVGTEVIKLQCLNQIAGNGRKPVGNQVTVNLTVLPAQPSRPAILTKEEQHSIESYNKIKGR